MCLGLLRCGYPHVRWRIYFFPVSKVGLPLMGYAAVQYTDCYLNRGNVLTACFRDIQSQRSIRMEFVIIMILFDVTDYRLLYIWQ